MSQQGLVVAGPQGRIELTGSALASLVARAAEAADRVRVRRSRKALSIAVNPLAVHVEITVQASSGAVLPAVGEAVQRSIAAAVKSSTGLPTRVDVTFEEVG